MTGRAQPTLRGLVVDWGGVLTTDVRLALESWASVEGIPAETLRSSFRQWLGPTEAAREIANPVHLLERGEIETTEFEFFLADALGRASGRRLEPEGLLARMFAFFTGAPAMNALVYRARHSGIRTALLSNSWGNHYPSEVWDGMFDAVVISGQVGMRKPELAIYQHACAQLRLAPQECVFVDDLEHNVSAAVEAGMVGVHHTSYEVTAAELSTLFGRDLTAGHDVP